MNKWALAIVLIVAACRREAPPDATVACADTQCVGSCVDGERTCRGARALVCQGGSWLERTCEVACAAGACRDCLDGDRRCRDEHTAEICTDGRYVPAACSNAQTCRGGHCMCAPGASACADETTRLVCGADRQWRQEPCPEETPLCAAGLGACLRCIPGSAVCVEDTASRVCSEDGLSERTVPCARGCDPGSGACFETCDPGALRCRDKLVVERCNDDGNSYEIFGSCDEANGEVCNQGECQLSCDVAAQTLAPAGCSFALPPGRYWYVDSGAANGRLVLELINPDPDFAAQVTVITEGASTAVRVERASSEIHTLPVRPVSARESRREAGTAVRVASSRPILVLAHHTGIVPETIPENANSGDAAYLLPEHLLRCAGRHYRVLAHPGVTHPGTHDFAYAGGVAIVSLSQEITAVQLVDLKGETLAGTGDLESFQPGESPILELQPNEVIYLMAAGGPRGCETCNDLTGTKVEVLTPSSAIALFTTGLSRVPVVMGAHVQTQFSEQLPPVALWDSEHVTSARHIPLGRPWDDERWVFVSDRDGTTLRFEPAAGAPILTQPLNAGDHFTFDSAAGSYPGYRAFRVVAEDSTGAPAPVLAGRYYHTGNSTAEAERKGGSSFEVERPTAYWRSEYWFSAVGDGDNRIQLIAPQGERPLLDGTPIPGAPAQSIPGFDVYSAPIAPGLHRASGAAKFSLLVYGHSNEIDSIALPPTDAYGYVGPLGFGDQLVGCEAL